MSASATVGIFVGGASSRMGSPKGLLPHPRGGTLLSQLVAACREASLPCVLVGRAAPYATVAPEVPRIDDTFEDAGPIGGLAALVAYGGGGPVISVACDMPYVDAGVLHALATDPRSAHVLAARASVAGMFEPMLARWAAAPTATAIATARARHDHSLQRLLAALEVQAFDVPSPRTTLDWDTPEDVGR